MAIKTNWPLTPAVLHILLALSTNERRIYYRITGLGQKALAAELERYRKVVTAAKRKTLSTNSYAYNQ